jgi:hypothetical protein
VERASHDVSVARIVLQSPFRRHRTGERERAFVAPRGALAGATAAAPIRPLRQ